MREVGFGYAGRGLLDFQDLLDGEKEKSRIWRVWGGPIFRSVREVGPFQNWFLGRADESPQLKYGSVVVSAAIQRRAIEIALLVEDYSSRR